LIALRDDLYLIFQLIEQTVTHHDAQAGLMTLHVDQDVSLRSNKMNSLLADLQVTKSISIFIFIFIFILDENPFSETQLQTMKYHYFFPDRPDYLQNELKYYETFFTWYNTEQKHFFMGLITLDCLYCLLVPIVRVQHKSALDSTYLARPTKFKDKLLMLLELPKTVLINQAGTQNDEATRNQNCSANL
jgi:hypothetical protein